jgi:hypothetical protein
MTQKERKRRTVLLCCHFARNLAYYEAGGSEHGRPLLDEMHLHASFWRQTNSNFLDMCVLEWCKLFGDRKAEHHWSKVVRDTASFEAALLWHLGMDAAGFQAEISAMRLYRDKFIAHLDELPIMDIPVLQTAKKAVWFYHAYIVKHNVSASELAGIPATSTEKFTAGYEQCIAEATAVFNNAENTARH